MKIKNVLTVTALCLMSITAAHADCNFKTVYDLTQKLIADQTQSAITPYAAKNIKIALFGRDLTNEALFTFTAVNSDGTSSWTSVGTARFDQNCEPIDSVIMPAKAEF